MSAEISNFGAGLGYERPKLADSTHQNLQTTTPHNPLQDSRNKELGNTNQATNPINSTHSATKPPISQPQEASSLTAKAQEAANKAEQAEKEDSELEARKPTEVSTEELKEALAEINSAFYSYNRSLRFELYDETEDLVVKVFNTKTDEVIRQYPSEEVLQHRSKLISGETNFFAAEVY